jgi:hypothetical protein
VQPWTGRRAVLVVVVLVVVLVVVKGVRPAMSDETSDERRAWSRVADVLMQILWDPRGARGQWAALPSNTKTQNSLGGAGVGRRARLACLRSQ